MSIADEIKKLEDLRAQGVISDEQFETQKTRLLEGGGTSGLADDGPMPESFMVQAILVTLFCCLPFGIVAIIKASSVNTAYASGNYDAALSASLEAKKWVNYGVGAGAIIFVLYFIAGMTGAIAL